MTKQMSLFNDNIIINGDIAESDNVVQSTVEKSNQPETESPNQEIVISQKTSGNK